MPFLFVPPARRNIQQLEGALRYSFDVALTVFRVGGQWQVVETPNQDQLDESDYVIPGTGRSVIVDDATATELTNAGIGACYPIVI